MNTEKVSKLANTVIENGVQKNYFTDAKVVDVDRITKSLLKKIKTLTKEELEILDLVISVRDDQNLTRLRLVIQEELKPIRKDIIEIKKVVGCNGDS